jgi:hypothetical protein
LPELAHPAKREPMSPSPDSVLDERAETPEVVLWEVSDPELLK